jgi:ABC-type cobalamin/Fe3+-siderophores transport system ATPase subunit
MPAGLLQMVGETGWQLSHGERSRLYIARTLLQRASMIILDEGLPPARWIPLRSNGRHLSTTPLTFRRVVANRRVNLEAAESTDF